MTPGISGPGALSIVRGWIQASHPFPIAAVLSLTALVGVASGGGDVDVRKLGSTLLTMLLAQLAIGWSNDYLDRDLDAVHQPAKPIPSGLVRAALLPPAIVLVAVGALAVGTQLGIEALACLAVGLGAGLVYNLWLKDSVLSPVAFIVAFAVLPPYVWFALDLYRDELLALYLVASPLAVGVHLANVLPDLETDTASGRRNLAVVLGPRFSRRLLLWAMCLPALLVAGSIVFIDYGRSLLIVLNVYGAFVLMGLALCERAERVQQVRGFRLLVVGSIVLVAGWLAVV